MGEQLKKLGVRLLLLATKSFVYLWQTVGRAVVDMLRAPMALLGRASLYATLFSLAPLYNVWRRFKKILETARRSPAPWLRPFVHRYALHTLTILLALITLYGNVARSLAAEDDDNHRQLILDLVESDEAFELVGLPPAPDSGFSNLSETNGGTDEDATSPLLSYMGEAAFQPYFPVTGTSIAPRRAVEQYTVADGDTIAGIAAKFRLKIETLLETNGLTARSIIRPGQSLSILPVDGVVHEVKRGENIGAIATRYTVSMESILSFNQIADAGAIVVGQKLIIPGGKAPAAPARPRPPTSSNVAVRGPATPPTDPGTKLVWPTSSRRINQYFTYRHSGLDIDGDIGSPIYASESGVVSISGWGGAYGNTILIKHDNGLVTRYGHHSKNLVSVGERVERGQLIALMGSTGRSTGPHLHFEVLSGNRRVNPFNYTR